MFGRGSRTESRGAAGAPPAPRGFARARAARRKSGAATARVEEGACTGTSVSRNATQDAIPMWSMGRDGICRVDQRRWSSCIVFDDVAWVSQCEDEKEQVGGLWGEFLDGLVDNGAEVKVWLLSKSIDSRSYLSRLAMPDVPFDDRGNALRREYNAYVSDKLSATSRSMRCTRALVVVVQADSHDEAAMKLGNVRIRAEQLFSALDAECRQLSGQERLDLIREVTRPDSARGKATFDLAAIQPTVTTRDLVAPDRIVRLDGGDLMVGNRLVRSYVITKYARRLWDSFFSSLTRLPVELTVSQHIRPWAQDRAIAFANRHYADVGGELNSYKLGRSHPERGVFVDTEDLPPAMRDEAAEAAALIDKLTRENQHLFSVTTIVTVYARTPEEFEEACEKVEAVFSEQLVEEVDHWDCLREQCWSTSLPIGSRLVPDRYEVPMPTEALEVYAPFSSVEVMDEGGVLMGVNADTNNLISYDQGLHEDTNAFVLGQPGKGKSSWSKLTFVQHVLREPDADVIVVDPENEDVSWVEEVGGSVIDVSETSDNHINLMQMSEFYGATDPDSPGNPLPRKVDFLQSAIRLMAASVSDEEKNVIDAGCTYVYARYMQTRREEDLPTLSSLYDYLLSVEGTTATDARHLASLIKRYVTGTLDVFNRRTDVDLANRVIDFVITDLNEELKPLAMMVILDFIWGKVTENRRVGRRTYLLIDETQILLEVDVVRRWLDRFFSRGRKWDFYITCVTQNVQRLLNIEECSYMFENTPLLVLTGQAPAAANLLGDLLALSDKQVQTLRQAKPGEGLYVFRHKVIHYDFRIDEKVCPRLYALTTTRPRDLKARRRARATGAPPSGSASTRPSRGRATTRSRSSRRPSSAGGYGCAPRRTGASEGSGSRRPGGRRSRARRSGSRWPTCSRGRGDSRGAPGNNNRKGGPIWATRKSTSTRAQPPPRACAAAPGPSGWRRSSSARPQAT